MLNVRAFLRRTSAAAIALAALSSPALAGYAAVVMDAQSGRILHAEHARAPNYPASVTKIMTLYLVFDELDAGRLRLGDPITISRKAAGAAPSRLGAAPGSSITVEQAILALVTKSANDVAVAVAEHLGGTEPAFAERMTEKAHALGMRDTTFKNASGLPNKAQKTTAMDLAILSRALIRNHPDQYRYFATRAFEFQGARHANHNKLLGKYDGIDGIKTGFINASGFNLAASAERNGRRLIAVVMGGATGRERDLRVAKLLDEAFGRPGKDPGAETSAPVAQTDTPAIQALIEHQEDQEVERQRATAAAKRQADREAARLAAAADAKRQAGKQADAERTGKRPTDSKPAIAARDEAERSTKTTPQVIKAGGLTLVSTGAGAKDTAKTAGGRGWTVQIGTYSQQPAAERAYQLARQDAPALLAAARPHTEKAGSGKKAVYRAQFVGLDNTKAQAVCAKLEAKGQDCLVIAPN